MLFRSNTNNNSIATTEFTTRAVGAAVTTINTALALKAPLASPTFTGTPKSTTPADGDNTTNIATTAFVKTAIDSRFSNEDLSQYAKKASPTFTGTPKTPKADDLDNTEQIASTSWVQTAFTTASVPKWNGSKQFVSYSAPASTDGDNGDIWFQLET